MTCTQVSGLRIAHVALPVPIQLSPLASISTRAFRILCEEEGCGLTWTEMVSVPGLVRNNPKIAALVRRSQPARPFAVQLVGARPEEMEEAARMVAAKGAELIDINMGCPVKKVAKTGGGVALMRSPDLAEALVWAAAKGAAQGARKRDDARILASERVSGQDASGKGASRRSASGQDASQVAITVKMRLGWDSQSQNAPELAQRLVQAGARAVTVHGRTRQAGFSGPVDLPGIRQVVEAVGHLVPVYGNGDVVDASSYLCMREETGCHGVMIGRAALGNPWVFAELVAAERGEPLPPPARAKDRIAAMERHLRLSLGDGPEKVVITELRKHLLWYSRGLAGSVPFRRHLQTTFTVAEVEEAIGVLADRQTDEQPLLAPGLGQE